MGDLPHAADARQAPGDIGRHPGIEVGLTGQAEVERLEPLGRPEQQPGCVAALACGEGDLAAQQVHPGLLELVERPGLRQ